MIEHLNTAPFKHAFETVDGLRLHYVTCGPQDAEPLVLLSGYPQQLVYVA